MLKISDFSENCGKSELDLFSLPPTQTVVESAIWDTIDPNDNGLSNPTITFKIPGDSLHYIDLAKTEIYCEVKVTNLQQNENNAMQSGNVKAIPVNNFLHSMFNDVQVHFGTTNVEKTNDMYAYKAYIEDTLNYDNESIIS